MKCQKVYNFTVLKGIVLGIALSFLGCRFGNRVQFPQSTDALSGFYGASPSVVESYAMVNGIEVGQILTPNQVPSTFSSVMTHPVALITSQSDQSIAFLVPAAALQNNGPTESFEVSIDRKTLELTFSGATAAVSFLGDPDCDWQFGRAILAQATSALQGQTIGNYTLKGNFEGQILQAEFLTEKVAGGCDDILLKAKNCILDFLQCGVTDPERSSFQTQVKAYFDAYLQNGTITVSDIEHITEFGMIVTYQ